MRRWTWMMVVLAIFLSLPVAAEPLKTGDNASVLQWVEQLWSELQGHWKIEPKGQGESPTSVEVIPDRNELGPGADPLG